MHLDKQHVRILYLNVSILDGKFAVSLNSKEWMGRKEYNTSTHPNKIAMHNLMDLNL